MLPYHALTYTEFLLPAPTAVMHADTLPQIFAGEIGPSGGCYL
jgi:hypothetical protein